MHSSSNSGRLLQLADALGPSPISILLNIYTTKTNLVVSSPRGSRTEKDNQDAGRGKEKSTPLCSRELLLLQRNSRYNCCNNSCSSATIEESNNHAASVHAQPLSSQGSRLKAL